MAQSRLGSLCHQTIITALTAVVIVVPLFFNPHSQRSFEPDKVVALRSIVVMMAAAWVVKVVEERVSRRVSKQIPQPAHPRAKPSPGYLTPGNSPDHERRLNPRSLHLRLSSLSRIPFLWLAGGLLVACAVATGDSLSFRTSLWGSYERSQGLYTVASYIGLFVLTVHVLRSRRDVERIVTTILLVSIPVALYGVMQHYRLDPFVWSRQPDFLVQRAATTLGWPIFAAAYLAMVIPLTLVRLAEGIAACVRKDDLSSALPSAAIYFFLLVLQLASFVFTQSRGPLLGLLGGLMLGALLIAVLKGQGQLVLGAALVSVEIILFFAILNLPNTPMQRLKEARYFNRLGRVFQVGSGSGAQRALMWQGAVDLLAHNPQRGLIGYGLDTIQEALDPHLPPELAGIYGRGEWATDRTHNETFDALITTGLIGAAVSLVLFGAVFYFGHQWLGLLRTTRQRRGFALLCVGGMVVATWSLRVLDGSWRFSGVAIPVGMIAGVFAYLLLAGILVERVTSGQPGQTAPLDSQQFLLVGLLAAMTTHIIEIQFGIPTATTRAYFWIYLALMVVLARYASQWPEGLTTRALAGLSALRRGRRRRVPASTSQRKPRDTSRRLTGYVSHSLMTGLLLSTLGFDFLISSPDLAGPRINVLWLLAATWILSGMLGYEADDGGEFADGATSSGSSLLIHQALALVWFLLFTLGYAVVWKPGAEASWTIVLYLAWILLTILAAAAVRLPPSKELSVAWRRGWPLYLLVAVGLALVVRINANFIRADIHFREGLQAASADASIAQYQRALGLSGNEGRYYTALAEAYIVKARGAADPNQMDLRFEQGREALQKGWQSNPHSADAVANLGRLHLEWATLTAEFGAQATQLANALEFYQRASAMSPRLKVLVAEETSQANVLLGQAYASMGDGNKAQEAYEAALEVSSDESAWTYLAQGSLSLQVGDAEAAAMAAQQAGELDPENYAVHWSLAWIYRQLDETEKAMREAEATRQLAPSALRPALEAFIRQLQEEPSL